MAIAVLLMFIGLSVISYGYVIVKGPQKFHADAVFRQRFKFVMNRWHPTWYYWGSIQLTRNILLCLVPVAFTEGQTQLYMMYFVFSPVLLSTLCAWPWRERIANLNDFILSSCFLTILTLCCLLTPEPAGGSRKTVGGLIMFIFCFA